MRARIGGPASSWTVRAVTSMPTTERVTAIPAPSRSACCKARRASFFTGHAGWKAKVVLDPRRRFGLSARCLAFDDDCPEPFRGAVDSSGEPRRSTTQNHRVVLRFARARLQTEALGDTASRGANERRAVVAMDRRQIIGGERRSGPVLLKRRIVRRHPVEGDAIPRQEGAELTQASSSDLPRASRAFSRG